MKKSAKFIAAGTIAVAGASATALCASVCPVLAVPMKTFFLASVSAVLKS